MQNYLDLLSNVLENGTDRPDRTGIGSRFLSGQTLRWDLADGFPMVTTRKMFFRLAFEETMFFLRGQTDTKILEAKNVNLWKGNTSREFLDAVGLVDLPEGSLGTGYSHQWRNFGGTLGMQDGVDQIYDLLEGIRISPTGRRHIVSAWNPPQVTGTPLPPCHLMHMYSVNPDKNTLNSTFIIRSSDLYLGLPFNILGYAFLNILFAKHLGLDPGELVYFGWDAHLYLDSLDAARLQADREPKPLPTLHIVPSVETFDDMLRVEYTDLELEGYEYHKKPLPKVKMAI